MFYYILKYHWVLWLILLFMFFPFTKDDIWLIYFGIGLGILFSIARYLDLRRQKRLSEQGKSVSGKK